MQTELASPFPLNPHGVLKAKGTSAHMGLASYWIPAALQRKRKDIYVHKTSTPSPWVPTALQKEKESA